MNKLPDSHRVLLKHAQAFEAFDLNQAFAENPARANILALPFHDWRVDVSRQHITTQTLQLLYDHAEAQDMSGWIEALFTGESLNVTEGRSALHMALRQQDDTPLYLDRNNIISDIRAAQTAMRELSEALRDGRYRGADGQAIRTVVHIGVGGSYLGPHLVCDVMACDIERSGVADFDVRFVANLDGEALRCALHGLDPATTLFIVVSKTFTTEETMTNARDARAWLQRHSHSSDTQAWARQMIAVTAAPQVAQAFGVPETQILPFWDWVGGRFSLWSAVGVALAIQSGWPVFEKLLQGAAAMDEHFRTTPLEDNIPVTLALVDWWNTCFLQRQERVIAPYAHALRLLPAYLQQLLMESNGKCVRRDGSPLNMRTTTSVWGGVGTDSQHAFFQWLHQGVHAATVEFIVPVRAAQDASRPALAAHALAQAQALMCGRGSAKSDEVNPTAADAAATARDCPGNVASTMLLLPQLDAWHLGALLALYEHRTFVEGVLYGINPFDQFGVELGKMLAKPLCAALDGQTPLPAETDAATHAQFDYVRRHAAPAAGEVAVALAAELKAE